MLGLTQVWQGNSLFILPPSLVAAFISHIQTPLFITTDAKNLTHTGLQIPSVDMRKSTVFSFPPSPLYSNVSYARSKEK